MDDRGYTFVQRRIIVVGNQHGHPDDFDVSDVLVSQSAIPCVL